MASNRKAIRFELDPRNHRGYVHAVKSMEKAASTDLRNEVSAISKWCAAEIKAAAGSGPFPNQEIAVAKTVRAQRDRMPFVAIGGARKVFKNGAAAGLAMMGSEFGASPTGPGAFKNGGRRFPFRTGKNGRGDVGYWIFPTLKKNQPEITRRWKNAVDKVLENW